MLDVQLEKVCGTADAGVVIADQVFAAQRFAGVVQGEDLGDVGSQVVFDLAQVLRRGRDDFGFGDQAVVANPVAVVQQAAGASVAWHPVLGRGS